MYSFFFSCFSVVFSISLINYLFFFTLGVICFLVLFYNFFYMGHELFFNYYMVVMFLFIFSMLLFISSRSSFFIFLWWDMLGASSFFLILFYGSWGSSLGALSTSLVMRFGDLFLLTFLQFYFFDFSLYFFGFLNIFFLVISSFTKGAQFPFMGWLTRAMSAPTPISSLVHSSTLVVSGAFLFFIFSFITLSLYSFYFYIFSLFSLIFAGFFSCLEEDYKKLVALSTLSQVSFCTLILGMGYILSSYLHILSHAYIKSVLFMVVGASIYVMVGQQDLRFISSRFNNMSMLLLLEMCLFGLCGLFFSSMTLSKEGALSIYFSGTYSFLFIIFFLFGLFLTFLYVSRLWAGYVNYMGVGILGSTTSFNLLMVVQGSLFIFFFLNFFFSNFFFSIPFFGGLDFIMGLYFYFCFLLLFFYFSLNYYSTFFFAPGFSNSYVFDLLFRYLQIFFLFEYFFFKILSNILFFLIAVRTSFYYFLSGFFSLMSLFIYCLFLMLL